MLAELEAIKAQLAGHRTLLVGISGALDQQGGARVAEQATLAATLGRIEATTSGTGAGVALIARKVTWHPPLGPNEGWEPEPLARSRPVGSEVEFLRAAMLAEIGDVAATLACVDPAKLTDPADQDEYFAILEEGEALRQEVNAGLWIDAQCGGDSLAGLQGKVGYWQFKASQAAADAEWRSQWESPAQP